MDTILKQLFELLLSAVPTVILFWVLYFAYYLLLHKPLLRVLRERHERTAGAVQKARADIAAAEAKTAEYEQRMREARASMYRSLEARRKQASEARAAGVAETRKATDAKLAEARTAIERDTAAARQSLQGESERLAEQVINAVLRPATATTGGRQ